ncbi:f0b34f14-72c6-4337-9395-86dfa5e5da3c [Thermothielavioides terrestris]|uniref:F0b34f14-72c6-4337-9395-86dfa5e5da3c n=1 Tax=Thermothielavioides terrestris TaxID=2587410 RepID=A0A3S4AJ94_9PEZI|nr:f0b34f14-72c6-4337-9395-86dfa5e5da3c [Thermothielavioides terrestris]
MATVDTVADAGTARPSATEKQPIVVPVADANAGPDDRKSPRAFERLPDEIIQQILQASDANGFASLALLNTKWRSVAQQAHLYAHHLASCPSYATSHHAPPQATSDDDLPRLRRLFAREVKRNLFEAYLRPKRTVIKVISNSISSSSCPGGEGIQFSPSPKGHHLLAYNSSRIHVIDLRRPEIEVKREFKILRRPAATCINDEGTLLAVLLTEMEVDIYDLTQSPPKRTQSMILDHSPRAIALSPCGSVLAAAYEGGIEVTSLNPGAVTAERRAVKCDGVDALAFSFDGTQILGTTVQSSQPNTVILTAPYYDPGSHMADHDISALWTTSILFPNSSRDCSHAVLVQNGKHEEAAWTFTYDRSFETFRAVRIDDLRNGTTYFTGPLPSPDSQAKLLPCTLPAASYYGELVSAGFQGKEIWLYGIPEDLDAVPVPDAAGAGAESGSNANGLFRRNSGPSLRASPRIQDNNSEPARVPQWQILCDKLRNTFVSGYKIGELEGVTTVKFVADFADSSMKERLIVAARGAVANMSVTDDEGIDFVDGGRITILDFDYGVRDGTVDEYAIEVGTKEPEVLEEEHRDIDTEVAIVRRRTVAQKRGSRSAALMRSVTSASRPPPLPPQPPTRPEDDEDDPLVPRRIGVPPVRSVQQTAAADDTETQSIEEQEALDAPYTHASPRSGPTLRRAATAAAHTRRLHPSAAAGGHIVYRRADGRAEHPHESDADNWVPPPPPYQKEDPGDLPSFLRHAAISLPSGPAIEPAEGQANQPRDRQAIRNSSASMHQQPRRAETSASANRYSSPVPPVPPLPSLSDIPPVPPMPAIPPAIAGSLAPPVAPVPHARTHGRGGSSGAQSTSEEAVRPASRDSRYLEGDNIYDVSPPDSPVLPPVAQHVSRDHGDSRVANGSLMPPANENPAASEPSVRRLSVSRTWPIQPMPIKTNNAPAGYPYSAPPINGNEALSQTFPPLPTAEQMPISAHQASAARPLSGNFQLPRAFTDNSTNDEKNWHRTSYQRPVSQQQHYSFPRPQPQSPGAPFPARATMHEPQPRRPHDMSPALPGEDMPLIISTPKGVSGAFDPPGRQPSERRAETPILAPVPRHPRPQAQASILRPAQERPDPVYGSNAGAASLPPPLPLPQPLPPPHPSQGGVLMVPSAPGSASTGFSRRVPGLSRKQSRAERSAAKNVADAKRRGWTGRSTRGKSKRGNGKKKKERDFDAASSAAWTDVTVTAYSVRSGFAGLGGGGGIGGAGQAAIDGVEEWLGLAKRTSSSSHDAAVVLVSRALASWLDDDVFLSRLLASTGIPSGTEAKGLTVVAAAVDEVPRYDRRLDLFCSSEGVSVLRGNAAKLLPAPDPASDAAATTPTPSLEFAPPPCRHAGRLAATVPLANTLFSNGRPHALFVSRWRSSNPQEPPRLLEKLPKSSQRILLSAADTGLQESSSSAVLSHLVPVTAPRRITRGLGNILREVQKDGSEAQPASTELEDVIPRLLEARRKALGDADGQDHPSGPIDVWALLIPSSYADKSRLIVPDWDWSNYHADDEIKTARILAGNMDRFLGGGCQLRKVLSGGGGWGAKRGMLSLDPQTQLTKDEDQDFENFKASFESEGATGDLVTRGSYVQFLVSPVRPSRAGWITADSRRWDPYESSRTLPAKPVTVFGTSAAPFRASLADSLNVWPNLFGAASSQAVYLSRYPAGQVSDDEPAVGSKMDAPYSYLASSG